MLRRRSFRFLVRAPAAGTFEATLRGRRGLVVAKGRRRFRAAGQKRLRIRVTRRGRVYLRRNRRPRLTLRLAFKPAGAKRVRLSRRLRLR